MLAWKEMLEGKSVCAMHTHPGDPGGGARSRELLLCREGQRGAGIPPAPALRWREGGVAPWWLSQLLGMDWGLPRRSPMCHHPPGWAWGLRLCLPGLVGSWTGLDRECGHVPPVPLPPGQAHPGAEHGRVGSGLCPSVGPESILPGHSLPELLLLLWGTAGCHRGEGQGGGGVPSPCWQLWGGCCGSCWSSRAGLGCAGTIAALGLRGWVGTDSL